MIIKQRGIALFQVLITITILVGIFGIILSKQIRLQAKLSTSITLMKLEQIELSAERMVLDFLQQDRELIANQSGGFDWPLLMDEPLENILGSTIEYSIYPQDGIWSINLIYQNNIEALKTPPVEILSRAVNSNSQDSSGAQESDLNNLGFLDSSNIEDVSQSNISDMLLEVAAFVQNSQISGRNFDYEEPYYLKSGLPFADLSEVLLVSEREPEQRYDLLNVLKDNFSVLPAGAKLNINEASNNVLGSIHPEIKDGIISEIIKITDSAGFKSIDAFLNLESLSPFKDEIPSELLTVQSEYFVARILVTMPTEEGQEPIERMRDIFIHRPVDQSKPVKIYQRKFIPF